MSARTFEARNMTAPDHTLRRRKNPCIEEGIQTWTPIGGPDRMPIDNGRSRAEARMPSSIPLEPGAPDLFDLKSFGARIAARDPDRQNTEVHIRAALINRFSALGTAEIVRVA